MDGFKLFTVFFIIAAASFAGCFIPGWWVPLIMFNAIGFLLMALAVAGVDAVRMVLEKKEQKYWTQEKVDAFLEDIYGERESYEFSGSADVLPGGVKNGDNNRKTDKQNNCKYCHPIPGPWKYETHCHFCGRELKKQKEV